MVVARKDNLLLFINTCDIQSADMYSVCFFGVCTVTNFSAEGKASGVTFCTAVHRRPRQGISHFRELCSPEAKIGRMGERAGHAHRDRNITVKKRGRKRHARDAPFVKSRGVWT